eukprot:1753401-Pleurochrysis_carterae.AAC.1
MSASHVLRCASPLIAQACCKLFVSHPSSLVCAAEAVQRGPVRREELRALHQNGAITGDTLVWNDEVQTTWAQLEEQRLIRM